MNQGPSAEFQAEAEREWTALHRLDSDAGSEWSSVSEGRCRHHAASSCNWRDLMKRAGLPPTPVQGATSLTTTARAAATAPSPMETPGPTKTSAHSQAPEATAIGAVMRRMCGLLMSWLAVQR